jgi:nucleotide-binding universal stress UspA family protein
MVTLRRILLTTDFSDNARTAYPCAASLAKQFGATIDLVYFAYKGPPKYSGISEQTYVQELRKALQQEADVADFAGVHVQKHLLRHPHLPEALRSFERAANLDLAITSTHGRTGLKHFLFGSFAERVLRNSSVPVLVNRERQGSGTFADPERVLVPFDYSDAASGTLPAVQFLATHYGCTFRFLFVYESYPGRIGLYEKMWKGIASRPKSTEQQFAELKQNELAGIDVELETCDGIPAVEIVHRARDLEADLIVIGTHGTLGSVPQNVTREAHCPILIVPRKNHD